MAARKVDYLLIGGGLASRELRALAARGRRRRASAARRAASPIRPYNRPDCSKGYLRGEETREEPLFRPDEWWGEQDIELLTRTSVTGLDLEARTAKLSSKEEIEFGKALIATGANVRRLNVDGCELEQIHYLRTLGNADAIREGVRGRRGGGADRRLLHRLRGRGVADACSASSCTIVMQEQATLERGFGERAGRFFQELLEAHGVTDPRRRRAGALRGRRARRAR